MNRLSSCMALVLLVLLALPAQANKYPTLDSPNRPSDEELISWMKVPALETLSHVEYVRINEANYQREVVDFSGPTMVAFLADAPSGTERNSSRGMAALVRALKTIHPKVKLCVYMVNEKGVVTAKEFEPLIEEYELRNVPALLFYNDPGKYGQNELNLHRLEKDIIWEADLLLYVDFYARGFFPEYMLREYLGQ